MTTTATHATGRVGERPLSALQEAMWVGWQLDPGRWLHIVPLTFVVHGDLDLERFRDAVDALCRRHPELAGRVATGRDGPRMRWGDSPPVPFVEHRVERRDAFDDAVSRARAEPVDVARGPLTRITVVHGPGATTIVLTVHHLVLDGGSIPSLVDELRRAYDGEPLGDPPDPRPWAAYVRRSWELATGDAGEPLRRYWRTTLGGEVPSHPLPAHPVPGSHGVGTRRATVVGVPADVDDRARRTAQELGVSWFTVVFGALYVVLHRYTGAGDLLVSTPYHGRSDPGLAGRIGSFANTLPVRERVDPRETYAVLLRRLRASVRGALAHGDLPLPAILRAANLLGPEARARTHEVVLTYVDTVRAAPVDVRHVPLAHGDRRAELDLVDLSTASDQRLSILLQRDHDGCRAIWRDHQGDLDPELVAAIARDHADVMADMATTPRRTVAEGLALLQPVPAAAARSGAPERARDVPAPVETRPREAPETVVADLAAVWRDVLDVPTVAADDSFFALGGHSLLASRLVGRIGERLDVTVSVRDLFTHPVLADLAVLVRDRQDGCSRPDGPVGPGDPAGPAPDVFPASRFQEGIWLAERLDPTHARYAIPLAWNVIGPLDPHRLAESLELLVARHEILRTRFVEDDGCLWQEVGSPWAPELDREDLTGLEAAQRDERTARWSADASAALSPATGRALRAALFRTGPDGGVLCLCAHHLVLDGESVRLLVTDLGRCYEAVTGGPAPSEPERQYRDLVAAEEHRTPEADLEHWRERLAGAPSSLGLRGPDEPGPHGAVALPLAPGVGQALLPVRIEHRVSAFIVEATAVAAVLHRWTGLADLTVGVPVARRVGSGDGGVLGPSLNTLVLRSRCDPDTTLATVLTRMREEIVAAVELQDAPFEDVVRALRPPRERGATPYVDVMLNHVGLATWSARLGPAELTPVDFVADAAEVSKFAATITFAEGAGALRGALAYRGDRLGEATARRLAASLADVLNRFAELLECPLGDLEDLRELR